MKTAYRDMWVHIEHHDGTVEQVSLELCCEARKLCDRSGDRLIAVVVGELPAVEVERLRECGIDGMLRVSDADYPRYSTQGYTALYTTLCQKYRPSVVLVGATADGRDFAPRFAARLETGCTSDATEVVYNEQTGDLEFIEPAAGGKIMAVITIPELRPQVGTIRPGTFSYMPGGKQESFVEVEEMIPFDKGEDPVRFLKYEPEMVDPALEISDCEVVVCVGNGVKDGSIELYRRLAQALGGKLAGTRPVVDRGLLSEKLQVGQSGVMIKPRLYVGFGISGAVNHVLGVSAGTFVAVNTDPDAPIFNYCDYGIIGDMDEVCRAWLKELGA